VDHRDGQGDPQARRAPSGDGGPGRLEPGSTGPDLRLPTEVVAPGLDFLCVHLYPKAGRLDEATETLRGFAEAGKPVLIEETFPLMCSADEFRAFLKASKPLAAGWVGFYWGETVEELKAKDPKTIHDAFKLGWLEIFRAGPP
jgi:hypothetical protein